MSSWTYVLTRLNGDGTETPIKSVSGSKPSLTRVLTGPHQITLEVELPDPDLVLPGGSLAIVRKRTGVYAEDPNGNLWVGGYVADFKIDGPVLSLDVTGFTTFIKGQPFDGDYVRLAIDPLQIVRDIWAAQQSAPGGNLGLVVGDTTSTVRIGVPSTDSTATSTSTNENDTGTDGPIRLNWWSTADTGAKVDDLAASTPFDYLETHRWVGTDIVHELKLGWPSIGVQSGAKFILGENCLKIPSQDFGGDSVATEVWVFGAGEGRDRLRGVAPIGTANALRTVQIVTDKTLLTQADVNRRAMLEADAIARSQNSNLADGDMTELVVERDHPNAPWGSYDVGDTAYYAGDHDWGTVEQWVKIVKISLSPDDSDNPVITIVRSSTVTS